MDTHKWKSWELVVYLGLVGLLTWYSLVRLDVKATYYVSEAVRSSIGDTSRRALVLAVTWFGGMESLLRGSVSAVTVLSIDCSIPPPPLYMQCQKL